MKSRIGSLLFLLLIVGIVLTVRWRQRPQPPAPLPEVTADPGMVPSLRSALPQAEAMNSSIERTATTAAGSGSTNVSPALSDEAKEGIVESKIRQLSDWVEAGDDGALRKITEELAHQLPEVRAAAVDALRDFGSREAIPALKEAVGRTDDPREKARLLEAVDFLGLPTLTELREQRKARASASETKKPVAPAGATNR